MYMYISDGSHSVGFATADGGFVKTNKAQLMHHIEDLSVSQETCSTEASQ